MNNKEIRRCKREAGVMDEKIRVTGGTEQREDDK